MEVKPDQLGRHEEQAKRLVLGEVERSWAVFCESVKFLGRRAKELGVGLLLENNVVSPVHREAGLERGLFLAAPGEVADALEKWSEWSVGLLLDVGHAKVAGETLGFDPRDFFQLGEKIGGLHLSDNNGRWDGNDPFDEGTWFGEFLGACAEVPWVIEVYGMEAEERRLQYETVRRMIEK
jgi:sugar phosphate isomerase/epimerase